MLARTGGRAAAAATQGRSPRARAGTLHRGRPDDAANPLTENEMAEMTEMRDLLLHELGDLLYAERRFVTATKTMARETQDPEVRARVEQHVRETETQVERLKSAFEAIGETPKGEKCEAAIGLREEHDSFKSEEKPSRSILSAFDLGSGLRIEHYEIAGYRSAIALANALGEPECARILGENLKEEVEMASFLEKSAPRVLGGMARDMMA
jgi:ferritin-like metal-binding protein YciE